MFHPLSLIIPVLVLIPNLFFFLKSPVNIPAHQPKEPLLLTILERLGQIGCFLIPLFYSVSYSGVFEILASIAMAIMLVIYYYGWIRFFTHNREYRWLFYPLFSIPVPLALSPVIYFLLSSVILHSYPILLSSLILAVGHIPVSLKSAQ